MRVTIAINNYNYERFLGAAIDSALGQDHPDTEVVVVDDGSSDGSPALIESYGDRVVSLCKANGGQGSAFNRGFELASGDIVIFLDADDVLAPDCASSVAATFARHPSAAAVQYQLRHVDDAGQPLGRIQPPDPETLPDGDLRAHVARFRCYHWQPTTGNAYRRSALAKILPMPEDRYRISADAYVNELIPYCGEVRRVGRPLADYRVHGTSNYGAKGVDAAFFRNKLDQIEGGHANLVRLAGPLDANDIPVAPDGQLDAAYLGFRLASLVVDPSGHPHPADRRGPLARRGIAASLRNPAFSWTNRLRRGAFFLVAGSAPRAVARRAVERFTPDVPRR